MIEYLQLHRSVGPKYWMYIKYISAMVHLSEMSDDATLAVNVEFLLREINHTTLNYHMMIN